MATPAPSKKIETTQDVVVLVIEHSSDSSDLRMAVRTLVTALPNVDQVGVLEFNDNERVLIRDGGPELRPVLR